LSNSTFKDTKMHRVQSKCNKMVTSAMLPSHHLKSDNSKDSINFFSFTAIVQTMWPNQ